MPPCKQINLTGSTWAQKEKGNPSSEAEEHMPGRGHGSWSGSFHSSAIVAISKLQERRGKGGCFTAKQNSPTHGMFGCVFVSFVVELGLYLALVQKRQQLRDLL